MSHLRNKIIPEGNVRHMHAKIGGQGGLTHDLWTPSGEATLSWWFDAKDYDSLTLVSSKVSQWDDLSGNANHVTQATDADRPTYSPNGWTDGLPCLDWGASSNQKFLGLSRGANTDDFQDTYMVLAWDGGGASWPSQNGTISGYDGTGTFSGAGLQGHYLTTNWYAGGWPGNVRHNGDTSTKTGVFPGTVAGPLVLQFDAVSAVATACNGIRIGTDRANAGRGWRGRIAEVIILDTIASTALRQKIEGYLAHKWRIQLVSGHPYRDSPP